MWFWWFMFVSNLIIPTIQIIAGQMFRKSCPQNINYLFGYRTKRSVINMDTWKFAHNFCGQIWWKVGWIMLILSAIIQVPFFHSDDDTIGVVGMILSIAQLIVLIVSIIPTEIALKKTFHEDGTRK